MPKLRGAIAVALLFFAKYPLPRATGATRQTVPVVVALVSNFSEPSTSSANPYGNYLRLGVEQAIRDNVIQLRQHGIDLKIETFDYGTKNSNVASAARAALQSRAVAAIGYHFSSHALIAAPIHQKAGLALITPSATSDGLREFEGSVVRMSAPNELMANALAKFASQKLKAGRFAAIIAQDCAYCIDFGKAFRRALPSGSQVDEIFILENDTQFGEALAPLTKATYQAYLIPNRGLTASRLIRHLLSFGIRGPFLGADGWGDDAKEIQGIAEMGAFEGYSITQWFKPLVGRFGQRFAAQFRSEAGKEANDIAALAYDSGRLVIQALVSSKEPTRTEVLKALTAITEFESTTGKLTFPGPKRSLFLLTHGRADGITGRLLQ